KGATASLTVASDQASDRDPADRGHSPSPTLPKITIANDRRKRAQSFVRARPSELAFPSCDDAVRRAESIREERSSCGHTRGFTVRPAILVLVVSSVCAQAQAPPGARSQARNPPRAVHADSCVRSPIGAAAQ